MRAAPALAALALATGCGGRDAPAAIPRAPEVVDVMPSTSAAPTATTTAARPAATIQRPYPAGGSVGLGNQRVLDAAVVPFAKYLNAMHNRIHVHFADETLTKLDALPANDPLNDPKLTTRIEVVIEGASGKLVKESIVRTSGNSTFDDFALDAVRRAAPFGPADARMWSTDGNVYVHWEFMRDEVFACSTMHVRPYLLDLGAAPP